MGPRRAPTAAAAAAATAAAPRGPLERRRAFHVTAHGGHRFWAPLLAGAAIGAGIWAARYVLIQTRLSQEAGTPPPPKPDAAPAPAPAAPGQPTPAVANDGATAAAATAASSTFRPARRRGRVAPTEVVGLDIGTVALRLAGAPGYQAGGGAARATKAIDGSIATSFSPAYAVPQWDGRRLSAVRIAENAEGLRATPAYFGVAPRDSGDHAGAAVVGVAVRPGPARRAREVATG